MQRKSGKAFVKPAARAQERMPVIGFLNSRSPDEAKQSITGFRSGLRTNGYVDGQNVVIEYRWAEGEYGRLPGLAADLVRRDLAVLVATGGSIMRGRGRMLVPDQNEKI